MKEQGPIRPNDNREPMTVDHLIKTLQAIRRRYGGDVPVVMCDDEPVVQAGVVLTGDDDVAATPRVVVTDLYPENDERDKS